MRNCAFSLEPGCCVCWVFGSCALPWEEPVEFVFSVMKNLPKLSNSPLPAGWQAGSPEDISVSAGGACCWTPRPMKLDKSELSKRTWSKPGEARAAQQDPNREQNCRGVMNFVKVSLQQ